MYSAGYKIDTTRLARSRSPNYIVSDVDTEEQTSPLSNNQHSQSASQQQGVQTFDLLEHCSSWFSTETEVAGMAGVEPLLPKYTYSYTSEKKEWLCKQTFHFIDTSSSTPK